MESYCKHVIGPIVGQCQRIRSVHAGTRCLELVSKSLVPTSYCNQRGAAIVVRPPAPVAGVSAEGDLVRRGKADICFQEIVKSFLVLSLAKKLVPGQELLELRFFQELQAQASQPVTASEGGQNHRVDSTYVVHQVARRFQAIIQVAHPKGGIVVTAHIASGGGPPVGGSSSGSRFCFPQAVSGERGRTLWWS